MNASAGTADDTAREPTSETTAEALFGQFEVALADARSALKHMALLCSFRGPASYGAMTSAVEACVRALTHYHAVAQHEIDAEVVHLRFGAVLAKHFHASALRQADELDRLYLALRAARSWQEHSRAVFMTALVLSAELDAHASDLRRVLER
ncbi:MAG: hypothetical protein QM778_16640 [Myxococcales bacterium]